MCPCFTWTNSQRMSPYCSCVLPNLTQTMFLLPRCPPPTPLADCSVVDNIPVLTYAVSCTQAHCELIALKSPLHSITLFLLSFIWPVTPGLLISCASAGFDFIPMNDLALQLVGNSMLNWQVPHRPPAQRNQGLNPSSTTPGCGSLGMSLNPSECQYSQL